MYGCACSPPPSSSLVWSPNFFSLNLSTALFLPNNPPMKMLFHLPFSSVPKGIAHFQQKQKCSSTFLSKRLCFRWQIVLCQGDISCFCKPVNHTWTASPDHLFIFMRRRAEPLKLNQVLSNSLNISWIAGVNLKKCGMSLSLSLTS